MSEFAITNILQNCQDPYTRGFQVISHVEHEILGGDAYYVEGNTTMSDTQEFLAKLTTPDTDKEVHLMWHIETNGVLKAYFWEDAVGGMTGGVSQTPKNRNRTSTQGSSAIFTGGLASSSTAVGTLLSNWAVGGSVFKGSFGGSDNMVNELVLKPNTTYLRKLVSLSTGQVVSFRANWHECAPRKGLRVAD